MAEKQLVIKIDRSLYFPSAERFRDALGKATLNLNDENRVIVIDFSQVAEIDHTSLKVYFTLLVKINREIIFKFLSLILDAEISAFFVG